MFSRFIFSMLAPAAYVCGRLLVAALRLDTATIFYASARFSSSSFPLQFLQASIAIRVGDVLIMWERHYHHCSTVLEQHLIRWYYTSHRRRTGWIKCRFSPSLSLSFSFASWLVCLKFDLLRCRHLSSRTRKMGWCWREKPRGNLMPM